MASRRRWGLGLAGLLALVTVPGLVLAVGATEFAAYRYSPPEAAAVRAVPPAVSRPHDARKPTAVVVVGEKGANVSDTLVPYEVLAATGAFTVYTVAPQRRPIPLLGGLDLLPDLDLGELDSRLAGGAPAVTVVPEMPDTDPGSRADDAPVTRWLRDRGSRGLVLGVCTGARLVAEAGLLEGRAATSHWYRVAELEEDHPSTRWQRGVRYVDAGQVVTTGGLLSSVDGTLRVIERLLGSTAAADAARRVGWPYYSPGAPAPLPPSAVNPERGLVHLLLTIGDHAVRSRHGLTFLPRAGPAAISEVDRLLVPASASAGFAFEPALRAMATTMDRPTARWAAVVLEYPPDDLRLAGPAWPWGPTVVALSLGVAGAAAAVGALHLGGRRRQSRGGGGPAPEADKARNHEESTWNSRTS